MLVVGYYHYPCQGVISFVLAWAAVWRRVKPAGAGHVWFWWKTLFFHDVGKVMNTRLRGDNHGVAGRSFLLRKGYLSVFLVAGTGKLMRIHGMTDKICQSGPIFGPTSANP